MTVKVERTKKEFVMDDSCSASESLANFKFRMVSPGGGASGNMTVGAPSGQGVLCYGVLQNAPASGETAEISCYGITEIVANSAINAGVEVTVAAANGQIETAGSGDYVIGISREAAIQQGHCISVTLYNPYIKP